MIKVVRDRFKVIGPYVAGKSVLDIGCVDARPGGIKKYRSTGLHIFLKEKSRELVGVDIDPEGIEEMKKDGYRVICANAENMDIGRKFDCIVGGELIEHLSNPGLFLDNMAKHLNDEGHLILTTPNAFNIRLFWRILKKNDVKVHREHTCWYDPLTLTRLLTRHSFQAEKIFFTNRKKWYLKKYLFKPKYQIPKLITFLRPYFSGTVVVIAKKRAVSR